MLEFVIDELNARKGTWPALCRTLEPNEWESYYSWLQKLAQGRIPDPSVNRIQRLHDFFLAHPRSAEHEGARAA